MDTSILIAKYMGSVMLAASLSMFINRSQVDRILEDFTNSPGMIFLAGVMTLLMGLTLVIFHNKWEANWTVIITIFGWIGVVGGLMRMMFPIAAIAMGKRMIEHKGALAVIGVINTLLGAFLTY
ncbi:MAG: hypothetical protein MPJ78_07325, partial [Hyphomicrobiaceae bacterium]|nr:hypothetical protein [Hyphomicrobiaceae bacterium]